MPKWSKNEVVLIKQFQRGPFSLPWVSVAKGEGILFWSSHQTKTLKQPSQAAEVVRPKSTLTLAGNVQSPPSLHSLPRYLYLYLLRTCICGICIRIYNVQSPPLLHSLPIIPHHDDGVFFMKFYEPHDKKFVNLIIKSFATSIWSCWLCWCWWLWWSFSTCW